MEVVLYIDTREFKMHTTSIFEIGMIRN